MHFQFLGQQLTQLDVKTCQAPVLFEAERWHIGFKGDAQFATVIHVVDQFGLSKRAHQWQ